MKKILFVLLAGLFITVNVAHAQPYNEAWHVDKWCTEQGGIIEYVLPDRTRVDCLTETHAIEFDWANKWAESVGQSLHYAHMTGKKAGVVLIVEDNDERFITRLMRVANHSCIDVWLMPRQR